jgi:hypothetical protein
MAKTFEESAQNAIENPRVRSADYPPLIERGETLRDEQLAIVARATEDSVNFGLTEAERDAAAEKADRARRNAAALANAVAALQAKLAERQQSENAKAAEAERAAIIAERDALVERLRSEWPAMERAMIAMLTALKASNERLHAARLPEPTAEMVARGCGAPGVGVAPPRSLTETRLPSFAEVRDFAWPMPEQRFDWSESIRRDRIASTQARDAENARWAKYFVTPPADRREAVTIEAREGTGRLRRQAVLTLTAELVEKARAAGCTVEPAKPGETIGTPAAVATF